MRQVRNLPKCQCVFFPSFFPNAGHIVYSLNWWHLRAVENIAPMISDIQSRWQGFLTSKTQKSRESRQRGLFHPPSARVNATPWRDLRASARSTKPLDFLPVVPTPRRAWHWAKQRKASANVNGIRRGENQQHRVSVKQIWGMGEIGWGDGRAGDPRASWEFFQRPCIFVWNYKYHWCSCINSQVYLLPCVLPTVPTISRYFQEWSCTLCFCHHKTSFLLFMLGYLKICLQPFQA